MMEDDYELGQRKKDNMLYIYFCEILCWQEPIVIELLYRYSVVTDGNDDILKTTVVIFFNNFIYKFIQLNYISL